MKKSNQSADALLLAAIRFSTILINIVSSAILSRMVSLETYGTYSTANLIVSTAANLTILGMMDAANYFYHQQVLNKRECLHTIGFIQCCVGVLCAAVMWALRDEITHYFSNPRLTGIYTYILFRPLLENLSNSLLSLQISIGKARSVGIQNIFFSMGKLFAILIAVFISENIATILAAYLIMDAVTVCYYYYNFKVADFAINPMLFQKSLVVPILRYAVPMGVYVITNALSRDLDKLVIGYYENTARLAIYTNCATLLPLGIVSSAFLTIIIPVMTRLVQQEKYEPAGELFQDYLSIGYISTSILSMACIILAEEAIFLLYGEKYLPGKTIFILYILVDLIKFANISLVMVAKGKTQSLMYISLGMFVLNGILNLLLYKCVGFPGPAWATVITTLGTSVILLKKSGDILGISLIRLFDWKKLGKFNLWLIAVSALASKLREILLEWNVGFVFRLLVVGGIFCAVMCLLNFKLIKDLFCSINRVESKI